jgi:predicted nucleic acid-binding Zn ribbon protein
MIIFGCLFSFFLEEKYNPYNQKTLKQAISELIKVYQLQSKMSQTKLKAEWQNMMGNTIAKYTEQVFVKDKTLFVYVNNAALKNELIYNKDAILNKVNKSIGSDYVNTLIVK